MKIIWRQKELAFVEKLKLLLKVVYFQGSIFWTMSEMANP
jgi:hypothetical protein